MNEQYEKSLTKLELDKVPDLIRVRARTDGKAAVLCRLRRGVVGEHSQNLIQLQLGQ